MKIKTESPGQHQPNNSRGGGNRNRQLLGAILEECYQEDRPHRMLALDGGGIRGLITLGILEKIENLVKDKTGGKLCDYFDYIAGTSAGAIIAAGLARGMTTAELMEFYSSCGKQKFDPEWLVERIKYLC